MWLNRGAEGGGESLVAGRETNSAGLLQLWLALRKELFMLDGGCGLNRNTRLTTGSVCWGRVYSNSALYAGY